MAQQMDADDVLAGQLVVFGSAFSVLTIFLWIYSLRILGYV
jgi:predicted permease